MRDSWDRRWARDDFEPQFELGEADSSIREAVEDGWFRPGMRAIDIGCGAGYNAAWLARQGIETVGVDFSDAAIERARSIIDGNPILTFEVVDVVEPDAYRETFDVLVDRGCLHGIDRARRDVYARNLVSWARPDARLLLIVRNRDRTDEQVVARSSKVLEPAFDVVRSESVDLAGPYADEPIPAVAMRFLRVA